MKYSFHFGVGFCILLCLLQIFLMGREHVVPLPVELGYLAGTPMIFFFLVEGVIVLLRTNAISAFHLVISNLGIIKLFAPGEIELIN